MEELKLEDCIYFVLNIPLLNHQDNTSGGCIHPCTPLLYSKTGLYRGIHFSYLFSKT